MNGRGRQAALNSLQKQAVEAFEFVVDDAVPGILQGDQTRSPNPLMLKLGKVARNHHVLGPVEDDGGDVDTGEIGPPVLVPERDRGPDGADPRRGQGDVLKPPLGGLRLRTGKELIVTEIVGELRPVGGGLANQSVDGLTGQAIGIIRQRKMLCRSVAIWLKE